ncbi:hypothetical protein QR680_011086 [Steinernema hermaphroditum]|uniref:7TM GPCR serpentine receptor class x (Srx) domain-containing protein n=1 Tax=Steinernema hermaphroditum TaxID=289476 RepID=A0AA39MCW1_9BILA|nr:hypothetical protein QR680_011086 [Steinernema hermaphroditum]
MNASAFVFGFEMQGRGEPTAKDIVLGVLMFAISFCGALFGLLNIYIIYKLEVFHNAFGWFWATRTSAEVMTNVLHVVFTAPVTTFQPKNIPIELGFIAYIIGYVGALTACLLHQAVSANRLIAVFKPLQYKYIFSKANCIKMIIACLLPVPFILTLYFVIPCNMIGYSPTMYEFAFVSCEANFYRNYSIVGTVTNRFCLVICVFTIIVDSATAFKIIHIRKIQKIGKDDQQLRRDIRFFMQTSMQNVTMVITSICITVANNMYTMDLEVWRILGFYSIIVTHLTNALSLIIFNPEVRRRLFSSKVSFSETSQIQSTSHARQSI